MARRGDGPILAVRRMVAIALALAVPGTAVAQETPPIRSQCILPEPPFALTEANRLKGSALAQRLADKTIKYERHQTGPNFSGNVRYRFMMRADGSAIMQCEQKSAKARRWSPCGRFNEADPKATCRDVGVWRVEDGDIVVQRIALDMQGREEGHLSLHEEAGVLAVRRVRGPNYCMPGPIALE